MALAALVVAASLAHLVPFARAMATTSLWNDEIYTNIVFSGKGPVRVLTFYEGNSHVLYNLVSSVFPGRRSMDPLRARVFSFLAVGLLLGGGLTLLWRRKRYLEGALFFSVFALHREFLDLTLQARGYGFLALFAGVAAASAVRFLETGERRPFLVAAAATVLGTWTIPTFVFFGGSVLLLLFLRRPARDLLAIGAGAAAFSAALYVPLLGGLLEEMRLYPIRWGRFYSGFEQVGETIRLYFFPEALVSSAPAWLSFAVLAAIVVIPGLLPEDRRPEREAAWLLSSASLLFLTSCLALSTPPVRTTAFVAVPLVLAFLALLPRPETGSRVRAFLAAASLAFVMPASVSAVRAFHFVPMENWGELARFVEMTVPREGRIRVPKAGPLLAPYLPGRPPIVSGTGDDPFGQGVDLIVDDSRGEGVKLDGRLAPSSPLEFRFAQRRGGYLTAWLVPVPRETRHIAAIRRGAAVGGSGLLAVDLEPGLRYRSLVLRAPPGSVVSGTSWVGLESGWRSLDRESIVRGEDGLAVPLGGERVTALVLRLSSTTDAAPDASAVWAVPWD